MGVASKMMGVKPTKPMSSPSHFFLDKVSENRKKDIKAEAKGDKL